MRWMMIGAAVALAGCGGMTNEEEAALVENAVANAEAAAENATAIGEARDDSQQAPSRDGWIGKWAGVEGMILDIRKDGPRAGRYKVTNRWGLDDDMEGTFEAYATKKGIAFIRPDGTKEAVPTDGDATGLKYLAGKKDCLTIAPGEGYCRD
ncbi:hypothetical protein [Sphingomonas sp.]|uniref:hypothetical protein n=1 Tax=Sphingomonas sp. TaxID=28214 RepID=UPI001ED6EA8F|nr:hypothetical protein [Sphingomonas sp.]MBX3593513.1 hypothetical protein [Sphingomonas sp.]